MSLPLEIHQKLLESFPQLPSFVKHEDLAFANRAITAIALKRLTPSSEAVSGSQASSSSVNVTSILSELDVESRLKNLFSERFPFSKISEELSKEALQIPIPDANYIQTHEVVVEMLKARAANNQLVPGSSTWIEMQTLIDNLEGNVLGELLNDTYRNAKKSDPINGYCFLALLKMIFQEGSNSLLVLPSVIKLPSMNEIEANQELQAKIEADPELKAYLCPITGNLVVSDGVYLREDAAHNPRERYHDKAIRDWITAHHTDPFDRAPRTIADIKPDYKGREFVEKKLSTMLYGEHTVKSSVTDCSPATLDDFLKSCSSNLDFSSFRDRARISEVILFRSPSLDSGLFLERVDNNFWSFFMNNLRTISFEQWPNKEKVLTNLFEIVHKDFRVAISNILSSADCDDKTKEIGECFLKALTAEKTREAYPFLYRLQELLPHMNDRHVERIFGCSLPSFKENYRRDPKDPDSTCRLNFNGSRQVFTFGHLIMGMHRDPSAYNKTSLLAFNKDTDRLTWELPLERECLHCNMNTAQGLILLYADDANLHIFNPENGEKVTSIRLPAASVDKYDRIHLTPSGFCYFMVMENEKRMLYGGQISNGTWEQAFKIKTPGGGFEPKEELLCFEGFDEHIIINKDGTMLEFPRCTSLLCKEGNLFTVEEEKGSAGCTLARMGIDGTRKELKLPSHLILEAVCDDGSLICFENGSAIKPYFINLETGQVTRPEKSASSYGKKFIDPKKGAVWTWNDLSKKLWKHTKEGSQDMGTLESGRGTSFLHVDETSKLYFNDIPF